LPDIGLGIDNGLRNVAFSVSGDTAYTVNFNNGAATGGSLVRFVKGAVGVKDKPFTKIPGTYELLQNYPMSQTASLPDFITIVCILMVRCLRRV